MQELYKGFDTRTERNKEIRKIKNNLLKFNAGNFLLRKWIFFFIHNDINFIQLTYEEKKLLIDDILKDSNFINTWLSSAIITNRLSHIVIHKDNFFYDRQKDMVNVLYCINDKYGSNYDYDLVDFDKIKQELKLDDLRIQQAINTLLILGFINYDGNEYKPNKDVIRSFYKVMMVDIKDSLLITIDSIVEEMAKSIQKDNQKDCEKRKEKVLESLKNGKNSKQ